MPLIAIVEKAQRHGLTDYYESALKAAQDTLPPMTVEYLEELDSEIDEAISDMTEPPTEDQLNLLHPTMCENCED